MTPLIGVPIRIPGGPFTGLDIKLGARQGQFRGVDCGALHDYTAYYIAGDWRNAEFIPANARQVILEIQAAGRLTLKMLSQRGGYGLRFLQQCKDGRQPNPAIFIRLVRLMRDKQIMGRVFPLTGKLDIVYSTALQLLGMYGDYHSFSRYKHAARVRCGDGLELPCAIAQVMGLSPDIARRLQVLTWSETKITVSFRQDMDTRRHVRFRANSRYRYKGRMV